MLAEPLVAIRRRLEAGFGNVAVPLAGLVCGVVARSGLVVLADASSRPR